MPTPIYRNLTADRVAQDTYRRALREVISPGDVVLDLGTGTGIQAMFAAEVGASRVYAIELGPVAHLARRVIADNGWSDRITVLQGDAREIRLPEPVDVIVTHMWVFDCAELLPTVRRVCLKPGGRIVPRRFDLHAALVSSPQAHRTAFGMWAERPFDLDFGAAADESLRRTHTFRFTPGELVTAEERVATFDFATQDEARVRANLATRAARSGEIHGLSFSVAHWLTDDIVLSPQIPTSLPKSIWPQYFLGLRTPLSVSAGDALSVTLNLRLDLTGFAGEWSIAARGEPATRQVVLSTASLAAPRFREGPLRLSVVGESRRFVLDACDGARSGREIAEALRAAFPGRFESARDAELFVADVTDSLVATD